MWLARLSSSHDALFISTPSPSCASRQFCQLSIRVASLYSSFCLQRFSNLVWLVGYLGVQSTVLCLTHSILVVVAYLS